LHELALTLPISALACYKTFAQHWFEGACAEMLDVVRSVAHQNLLD
jgi:hypothetical protein